MKSYIFYIMVGFLLLITVLVSTETKGEIAPVESLDNVVAAGQPGITVVGEIRTVDTVANPRLWGKGRPGTRRCGTVGIESGLCMAGSIDYGLSLTIVDWGSTADACPAGT